MLLLVIEQIQCYFSTSLQIENLLFDSCGFVKLCDFGSATTEVFFPNDSWSVQQRQRLEEEVIPTRFVFLQLTLLDNCYFVCLKEIDANLNKIKQDIDNTFQLARHTTPMYRSPEILDLYSNFPIGPAQDVWVFFLVLFLFHF